MVNFLTRNWPMRWDKLWKHCVLRDFHLSIKIEQSSLIAFNENPTEWCVLLWKTFQTWNEWSASFISWGSVIVIHSREKKKLNANAVRHWIYWIYLQHNTPLITLVGFYPHVNIFILVVIMFSTSAWKFIFFSIEPRCYYIFTFRSIAC